MGGLRLEYCILGWGVLMMDGHGLGMVYEYMFCSKTNERLVYRRSELESANVFALTSNKAASDSLSVPHDQPIPSRRQKSPIILRPLPGRS